MGACSRRRLQAWVLRFKQALDARPERLAPKGNFGRLTVGALPGPGQEKGVDLMNEEKSEMSDPHDRFTTSTQPSRQSPTL